MTYELIQKLKRAGFVQYSITISPCSYKSFDDKGKPIWIDIHSGETVSEEPTLDELIAACKRRAYVAVFELRYSVTEEIINQAWSARIVQRIDGRDRAGIDFEATGSTAKEAVANLFLKLPDSFFGCIST